MPMVDDVEVEVLPDRSAARSKTLYEILEVSPTASLEVVKAAYTALSEAAPSGPLNARALAARVAELDEAYRVLSNPFRRERYNQKLDEASALEAETAASETTTRTCWRCREGIDPLGRYCSTCHWLVCEACRACGCQNADWLKQRPTRPVRLPTTAKALIAAAALLVGSSLGAVAAAQTGRPLIPLEVTAIVRCEVPAASTPAVTTATLPPGTNPAGLTPGTTRLSLAEAFIAAARALIPAR
jgi:hypothetical protein